MPMRGPIVKQNTPASLSPTGPLQCPSENPPQEDLLAPLTSDRQFIEKIASTSWRKSIGMTTSIATNQSRPMPGPESEALEDQPNRIEVLMADDSFLTTYSPSSSSSPLEDTGTSAIFWHFVNVTGPSMSLYGRDPIDYMRVWEPNPSPAAMRSLWTSA